MRREVTDLFTIQNLKFRSVLDITQLTLEKPVVCLVGASGSGKTTLLRHLNRLNEPDSGQIFYNGVDLKAIDPIELRRKVVMLGQTPVIYDGTILDNLQIGARFAKQPLPDNETMTAVLERVGLSKSLDSFCDKLSGGEKQRLCMARVMLMEAETYLMDEPSSALDWETEQFMIGNLVDYVREKGRQLIMVSHSLQVEEMFPDEVVTLEQGRLKGVEI